MNPLLQVEDLDVRFATPMGLVHAVRGVGFTMGREKLAIVGESGSGKSVTGRALMGLVAPPGRVSAHRLDFDGIALADAGPVAFRRLRGKRIGLVMQDPKFSLNPVQRIGEQISETLRLHTGLSSAAARSRSMAMLEAVRISDPERVYRAYPHELSGGMAQRAMLSMMLVAEPDLLIADEPTSALDVTVQLEILSILDEQIRLRGMGLIFISHDLRLVSRFCDRVLVMYAGRVVETIAAADLAHAKHPYTQGLYRCLPNLDRPGEKLPVLNRDPAWLTA
ncbi:ABC transporter ATP-binding protein [Roseomonas frigidaquae]|uniref:ABC transporter ATP-binding protein n=1 Tax=Falsiroseomonas frigidaquae TaxID=487318 RepID=A0ABX1F1S2_9PROT|nr:ABC transporter ATP-binding protein [Falsiroseomonas frigidaquae]NKE46284.1 ABC transporter ATP-binding protein [Falsiroseomonas frigidaquae]